MYLKIKNFLIQKSSKSSIFPNDTKALRRSKILRHPMFNMTTEMNSLIIIYRDGTYYCFSHNWICYDTGNINDSDCHFINHKHLFNIYLELITINSYYALVIYDFEDDDIDFSLNVYLILSAFSYNPLYLSELRWAFERFDNVYTLRSDGSLIKETKRFD